jgi:hypothetical protein
MDTVGLMRRSAHGNGARWLHRMCVIIASAGLTASALGLAVFWPWFLPGEAGWVWHEGATGTYNKDDAGRAIRAWRSKTGHLLFFVDHVFGDHLYVYAPERRTLTRLRNTYKPSYLWLLLPEQRVLPDNEKVTVWDAGPHHVTFELVFKPISSQRVTLRF